ncbi:MAG TPA: hypothetical protein VGK03_00355 [Geothrix sp.]
MAAQTVLATETWEAAATRLQAHVAAKQGPGAIVQIERVDAATVRVSLKTLWPRFRGASFQGGGDPSLRHRVGQVEGKGSNTFVGTTTIDPRTTHLDVRFHGSDFNPKIRMKLPASGQTEVGTVLMGVRSDI